MNFGEFARIKRKMFRLTQDETATRMGFLSRSGYQKLEKGPVQWTLNQVFLFASVIGIPAWELIREYEQKGGGDIVRKKGSGNSQY